MTNRYKWYFYTLVPWTVITGREKLHRYNYLIYHDRAVWNHGVKRLHVVQNPEPFILFVLLFLVGSYSTTRCKATWHVKSLYLYAWLASIPTHLQNEEYAKSNYFILIFAADRNPAVRVSWLPRYEPDFRSVAVFDTIHWPHLMGIPTYAHYSQWLLFFGSILC